MEAIAICSVCGGLRAVGHPCPQCAALGRSHPGPRARVPRAVAAPRDQVDPAPTALSRAAVPNPAPVNDDQPLRLVSHQLYRLP